MDRKELGSHEAASAPDPRDGFRPGSTTIRMDAQVLSLAE